MNEIEVYPGDVFTAGSHRFLCGDLEKDDCWDMLDIPQKIYMVYSDPPWNPGNARMWRTVSQLDDDPVKGTRGRMVDWDHFVDRFWAHVNHANPTHIFVEMGVKQTPEYIKMVGVPRFPDLQYEWNVFYASVRPNKLLYFSNVGGFTGNPEGMKNEPMTRHVFEHIAKEGEVVFDPCIGLGMTARMAHCFGMICYGIELNPARLARTLGWLSKHGYEILKT